MTDVSHRLCTGVLGLLVPLAIAGCSDRVAQLESPPVSPSTAAAKAMDIYDADHDKFLTRKELEKAPGLLQSLSRYDADQDKKISQSEIEQRLQKFVESNLGFLGYACQVTINDQPLRDAQVEFSPEPFLEGMVHPALGTTNAAGMADLMVDPTRLPAGAAVAFGLQFGIYKVRITHPTQKIPEKYNVSTTLGVEISPIDPSDPSVFRASLKPR